jgi:hypothetical protein
MSKRLPKGEVFKTMSDEELEDFREYLRDHRFESMFKLWSVSIFLPFITLVVWIGHPWHPSAIIMGIVALTFTPYLWYALWRETGYYRWLDSEDRQRGDDGDCK